MDINQAKRELDWLDDWRMELAEDLRVEDGLKRSEIILQLVEIRKREEEILHLLNREPDEQY